MLNVIWSDIADNRLEEIDKYLLITFGKKSVDEFRYKLISTVDLISQNNQIGTKISKKLRRFVVVKQISIIYSVSSEIEILSLWDNRQDPLNFQKLFSS